MLFVSDLWNDFIVIEINDVNAHLHKSATLLNGEVTTVGRAWECCRCFKMFLISPEQKMPIYNVRNYVALWQKWTAYHAELNYIIMGWMDKIDGFWRHDINAALEFAKNRRYKRRDENSVLINEWRQYTLPGIFFWYTNVLMAGENANHLPWRHNMALSWFILCSIFSFHKYLSVWHMYM